MHRVIGVYALQVSFAVLVLSGAWLRWMRRMTNTPSSASTSPVTPPSNRPRLHQLARLQRTSEVPSIQPAVAEMT